MNVIKFKKTQLFKYKTYMVQCTLLFHFLLQYSKLIGIMICVFFFFINLSDVSDADNQVKDIPL